MDLHFCFQSYCFLSRKKSRKGMTGEYLRRSNCVLLYAHFIVNIHKSQCLFNGKDNSKRCVLSLLMFSSCTILLHEGMTDGFCYTSFIHDGECPALMEASNYWRGCTWVHQAKVGSSSFSLWVQASLQATRTAVLQTRAPGIHGGHP